MKRVSFVVLAVLVCGLLSLTAPMVWGNDTREVPPEEEPEPDESGDPKILPRELDPEHNPELWQQRQRIWDRQKEERGGKATETISKVKQPCLTMDEYQRQYPRSKGRDICPPPAPDQSKQPAPRVVPTKAQCQDLCDAMLGCLDDYSKDVPGQCLQSCMGGNLGTPEEVEEYLACDGCETFFNTWARNRLP